MMKTMTLLTDAVEAHRLMHDQINTDILDAGTSWTTTALSKLLTSLDDMMLGHIDDSIALLGTLKDVYSKHVDCLVIGLSTQLQYCNSLTAQVYVICIRAQSVMRVREWERYRMSDLRDALKRLNSTLDDFDEMLVSEAQKSSHKWHYFPSRLRFANCRSKFRNIRKLLDKVVKWISSIISEVYHGRVKVEIDDITVASIMVLKSNMTSLSNCLMSYENELDNFKNELISVQELTFKAAFKYKPPTTSLRKFNIDGHWLESITRKYIANSRSKFQLAKDLYTNGSEVVTSANQLYSDIELTLFTEIIDLIDKQQTSMVSFYSDLLQRVASLQRYLFANDTKLEEFMRRLSIWRMPIINFQKAQVFLLLVVA